MRKKAAALIVILMTCPLMPVRGAPAPNSLETFEKGMALKRAEKFAEAVEVFSKIVSADPKNEDALQQLATILGWLKNYDQSISTWRRAIALNPNNVEYHVGLGRVLSWKGELHDAKTEYLRAHEIKKDDFDTLIGLGDIEMRLGNVNQARDYYLWAQAVRPNDPDLKKKLAGAVAPLLWRADAGYSYDGYSQSPGRVAEHNSYAQIGRQFSPAGVKSSLWLRHEWQQHFRTTDNTLFAGGSLWPFKPLAVQFEAGFTATPNFRPTQQYTGTLDFPISKFFIPSVVYKHLAYRNGNVEIYMPGARLEALPCLALVYRYSISQNITGPDTQAWQASLDFQVGEVLSMYAGYAEGNESLPPLSTAFNQTIFTGAIFQLGRQWAWRIDYSYENRPNFYLRSSLGSGLTFKF